MHRLVLAAVLVSCSACSDTPGPAPGTDPGTAASPTAEAVPTRPVDVATLRAALPAEVAGVARGAVEVDADSAMGVSVSQAEGQYPFQGGSYAVRIIDYGDVETMGLMGLGWIAADLDRQTGAVHERTARVGARRGYRRYDAASRTGEFSVAVADRFQVQVTGTGVEDDSLEVALGAVDLEAVASMRGAGRPEPDA